MYFPPSRLEARDALDKLAKRAPQRGGPLAGDDEDVNPIESWLSVVFGPNPLETSTSTTRSSTSTRSTPTPTLSSTRSTSSTSTRSTVVPPVTPTPTPSPTTSTTPRPRSTLVVTTNVDPNASQANDSNSSKGGLPSVVVGVIVAAAVIFGLIFISLIARKIFQSRRRRRRMTWAGTFEPPSDPREKELPPPPADTQEYTNTTTYPAYPPAALTFANANPPYSPAATTPHAAAPYPFSGPNTNATNNVNATMFNSSAYAPADLAGAVVITQTPPTPSTTATATAAASAPIATVKRTFIPSLPDELSIATGDRVRVLSVYDDGWAMCEKVATNEQGVVPQECLDSLPSTAVNQNMPGQQLASGSGGSSEESARLNRNSSLRRNQGQTY